MYICKHFKDILLRFKIKPYYEFIQNKILVRTKSYNLSTNYNTLCLKTVSFIKYYHLRKTVDL